MKKVISFFLVLFCLFSCFAAKGVAQTSSDVSYFTNPAEVFFYDGQHTLQFEALYTEEYDKSHDKFFLNDPNIDISLRFAAKRVAASLCFDVEAYPYESEKYNLTQDLIVDVAVAAGYKAFGAGLGIDISSTRIRSEIDVRNGYRLIDIIQGGLFEQKRRLIGSDMVKIRGGLQLKLSQFSFGILSNDLFIYKNDGSFISVKQILESLDAGVEWNQKRFGKRGSLNSFVMDVKTEFVSLFSKDVGLSVEVSGTVQFIRDFTITAYTGFTAPFRDMVLGTQSFGVKSRLDKVNLCLDVTYPLALYSKKSGDVSVKIGATVLI